MQTHHTPGQYSVNLRGFEQSALVKRGGTVVAEVFTDREPGDQYRTAALIAAAPDLLAALQSALDQLSALSFADDRIVYTRERARAAIARATGE